MAQGLILLNMVLAYAFAGWLLSRSSPVDWRVVVLIVGGVTAGVAVTYHLMLKGSHERETESPSDLWWVWGGSALLIALAGGVTSALLGGLLIGLPELFGQGGGDACRFDPDSCPF